MSRLHLLGSCRWETGDEKRPYIRLPCDVNHLFVGDNRNGRERLADENGGYQHQGQLAKHGVTEMQDIERWSHEAEYRKLARLDAHRHTG
jgi:hypothetical protein